MRRFLFILAFLLLATPASAATYLISWNDTADNETGWQVEQKVEGGSYSLVTTTAANVMVYSHATGSSNYRYRVRAVLPSGYGPYSNEACVPTACGAAPEFPHGTGSLAAEPSRLVAGTSGVLNGTAYFAASCSQANVTTAYNAVPAGGVVVVPAGACTWSSTLTITKAVRIRGAGLGSTTINASGVKPMIYFPASINCTSNPEFEITGFTFHNDDNSEIIRLWDSDNDVWPNGVCTKLNVHHNAFTGIVTENKSGVYYISMRGMGGVVWKNTFSGAWQYFVSLHSDDDSPFAALDAAINTAKALYFEDNVFTKVGTGDQYIADCQFLGLRIVWRYNTWIVPGSATHQTLLDWHGYAGYASCQGNLVYGNQFTFTDNGSVYDGLTNHRGGRSVQYFNNATTTTSGMKMSNIDGSYGCPTTYTTHQLIRDYSWNNRRNNTTLMANNDNDSSSVTCDGGSYPSENLHYFNYNTSMGIGGSGVGCGTLANRPASVANRSAYWATNGTCSTVAGYVGDIVTYPTRATIPDGTLYVYESGAWSAWYTPYAYPHPLRQGQ